MNSSIQGRIDHINSAEFVGDNRIFKQTFILDVTTDLRFLKFLEMELFGDAKKEIAAGLTVGDMVEVHFEVRGNKYQKDASTIKVFPAFNVWKIEKIIKQAYQSGTATVATSADPAAQAFDAAVKINEVRF